MGDQGFGAMLHALDGGSERDTRDYIGAEIVDAVFKGGTDEDEQEFIIEFKDGRKIKITDDAQSCCELRYMTCDDDPKDLIGGTLVNIEVREGAESDVEDEYGECHEVMFLLVSSTKGSITFSTHNEHNGYYGGFGLNINELSGRKDADKGRRQMKKYEYGITESYDGVHLIEQVNKAAAKGWEVQTFITVVVDSSSHVLHAAYIRREVPNA